MSKLLNELYTSRWYLTKQIEEMEKGSQFDKKGSHAAELKDNLEKLTKINFKLHHGKRYERSQFLVSECNYSQF